jgi:hypothetical protein
MRKWRFLLTLKHDIELGRAIRVCPIAPELHILEHIMDQIFDEIEKELVTV